MPDKWTWVAVYEDGSLIAERDLIDGVAHPWADVEPARVIELRALPIAQGLPMFGVVRKLDDPALPVFFRRRATAWLLAGGEGSTMHCLGLEWPDGHAAYTFWDDNGHVVLTSDRNAL